MNTPAPVDFYARSSALELMDAPTQDEVELSETLKQLGFLNRAFGGYAATLSGLARLLPAGQREFDVLDVGSGGGDTAQRIVSWAQRRGLVARVHGIDLAPEAVAHARRMHASTEGLEFTVSDLFELPETRLYDVVHSSLVLHHLPDEAAAKALGKMYALCRLGVVINDLHRHPLAYHSIEMLTSLFSKNRLIRHDAPLSVLRAFRRDELEALARRGGLAAPEISWHWAFRWLMVARK